MDDVQYEYRDGKNISMFKKTLKGKFAIVIAAQFLKSVIWKEAFKPDWISAAFLAVVGGVATVFGPNAAQRKKNREELAKKLFGK